MKLLRFFRRRRPRKGLLESVRVSGADRPLIPVTIWRHGRIVSHPQARVADPPPETLDLRMPRVYRTIDDVVNDLIQAKPEIDRYVLRYVAKEPRVAVYLYEAEAVALVKGA